MQDLFYILVCNLNQTCHSENYHKNDKSYFIINHIPKCVFEKILDRAKRNLKFSQLNFYNLII